MELTKKETAILKRIAESEFRNGGPVDTEPVWSVCESKADNAVVGSLVKKGLVYTQADQEGNIEGLTELGVSTYASITDEA